MSTGLLSGGFNEAILLPDHMVSRKPRDETKRAETLTAIQLEYEALGFVDHGLTFRVRSADEQVDFAERLRNLGILTAEYSGDKSDGIVYPFVEGETLDFHLMNGNVGPVVNALGSLMTANSKGVNIGDRWAKNTVITPTAQAVEIDFDVEIIGELRTSVALDMAQTIFHIIHFSISKVEVETALLQFLHANNHGNLVYDIPLVEDLLARQSTYFESLVTYEGIDAAITARAVERFILNMRDSRN
jgi:hypothetical protein